ncbi:hypothetical protein BC628DRAFT_1124354 [Trametes gibbosa]|nr:hypothetical protein BC628DRAFT_1124354 [Trametes gibbosa]
MVLSGLSTSSSQDELKCSATVKDFTPIYNHLDQDPCTIGEALVTTCGALSAYTDPKGHPNNACFCNSVMYSLVYVCGECLPKVAAQFQQPSSNYYSYFECQSPMDGEWVLVLSSEILAMVTIHEGTRVPFLRALQFPRGHTYH